MLRKRIVSLLLALLFILPHAARCQMQCNATNRQKRIVISSPEPRQLAKLDHCQYTVAPSSTQVCQVRIDFERFELPQPQLVFNERMECVDFLQVQHFRLCGRNTGQHLYVKLQRGETLQLLFSLGTHASDSKWRLTLTQLECQQQALVKAQPPPVTATVHPLLPFWGKLMPRTFFGNGAGLGLLPPQRPSTAYVHPLLPFWSNLLPRTFFGSNAGLSKQPAAADLELLAPLGCDQYYHSDTGGIVSFNFAGGIYMPDMNYAICVKSAGHSEISYTFEHFSLSKAQSNVSGPGYDADCHSMVSTLGRATDYLMIPNSYLASNQALQATYYCGSALAGTTIHARAPFIIYFSSDAQTSASETGFQLTYKVLA